MLLDGDPWKQIRHISRLDKKLQTKEVLITMKQHLIPCDDFNSQDSPKVQ